MTREIANWFHEREGELFTEAETPFDREELVSLTNDSVDPVQQVLVSGERYYGVIDYDEHDGWYEYTRWDDVHGEVNVGVCAKCVAEASSADEVARVIGDDIQTARQKFDQHYNEHDIDASEVSIETGATLLSGTTVNGNEAIHPGMDGSGSGVDADFVRGGTAVEENTTVPGSKSDQGTVQSKSSSPGGTPAGVGVDSSDSIWNADTTDNSLYKLDKSISVLKQISSPSNSPNGLELDSVDSIWVADSDSIYNLDRAGTVYSSFGLSSSIGVGVDSNDSLWVSNAFEDVYHLNQSGSTINQFSSPAGAATGVGVDMNDCIWHGDESNACIYQTDRTITTEKQFNSPSGSPQGIGIDSNGCMWNADGTIDLEKIYELNRFSNVQFN